MNSHLNIHTVSIYMNRTSGRIIRCSVVMERGTILKGRFRPLFVLMGWKSRKKAWKLFLLCVLLIVDIISPVVTEGDALIPKNCAMETDPLHRIIDLPLLRKTYLLNKHFPLDSWVNPFSLQIFQWALHVWSKIFPRELGQNFRHRSDFRLRQSAYMEFQRQD